MCAAAQFYRWHGELEAARTAEAEGKFREYAAALGGHLPPATPCWHWCPTLPYPYPRIKLIY